MRSVRAWLAVSVSLGAASGSFLLHEAMMDPSLPTGDYIAGSYLMAVLVIALVASGCLAIHWFFPPKGQHMDWKEPEVPGEIYYRSSWPVPEAEVDPLVTPMLHHAYSVDEQGVAHELPYHYETRPDSTVIKHMDNQPVGKHTTKEPEAVS